MIVQSAKQEILIIFKKYLHFIPLFLLISLVFSFWKFPPAAPILGILLLLAGLAISIFGIFEKHKDSENPRPKIAKDVLVLMITLLLIIFLGGLIGFFANSYIAPRFGMGVGYIAALAVSFIVGYLVKRGVGKLVRN